MPGIDRRPSGSGGGGGGGAPSGPAGGDLTGTYPNPTLNAPTAGVTLGLGKYVAVGYNGAPTWIDPAATDWADVLANGYGWVQFTFSGAGLMDVVAGNGTHAYIDFGTADSAIFGRRASTGTINDSDDGVTYGQSDLTSSMAAQNGDGGVSVDLTFNTDLVTGAVVLETNPTHTQLALVSLTDRNEQQRITVTGSPTGGTYTISNGIGTTGAIHLTDNQAALQALCDTAFGGGNTDVFFGDGTDFYVEWKGTYASQGRNLPTLTNNSLTGGSTPSVTFVRFQTGSTAQTDPLLNLDSVFTVAPDGSVGGVTPNDGDRITWDAGSGKAVWAAP